LLLAGSLLAACSSGSGGTIEGTPPPESTSTPSAPAATTTVPPAGSTSSATTSSPASSTTSSSTTAPPDATFSVPEADHCVIDTGSADHLNVRSGPGTGFGIVGTLGHDAAGVHAVGVGARDTRDRVWLEIDFGGATAWVASWYLTPGPCTVGADGEACVVDTSCTDRLNVRVGPGVEYARLGSLPFDAVGVVRTGAVSPDGAGRDWWQVSFRGEMGWAASWFLAPAPCEASTGQPCLLPSGPASASCSSGWTTPPPGSAEWTNVLAAIGVGVSTEADAFVVEEMRAFVGPEDADVVSPRPEVQRWYVAGYSETDPAYRGRWMVRSGGVGFGLAWTAPYDSAGFDSGIWETCPDGCIVGPPLAGEWCDPGCLEDPFVAPCAGVSPDAWSPGDCSGLPPEALGCLDGL
jgi:uncharacterized protein YraI